MFMFMALLVVDAILKRAVGWYGMDLMARDFHLITTNTQVVSSTDCARCCCCWMQVPVSRSQDDLGAGAKKVAPASQIPVSIFVFVFFFPFFLFVSGRRVDFNTH